VSGVPDFYTVLDASTMAAQQQSEQMGSKRKFWCCDLQSSRWFLFKYSRVNTGEHWSEKVAAEVANLLGLPHAAVELAVFEDVPGVLVLDVRRDREAMSLLHGNELLVEFDPAYPSRGDYRVSEHTVARVAQALQDHRVELPNSEALPRDLPAGVDDALGVFVGYLLLDAIIGNTDRHHENWAVVVTRDASSTRVLRLAPTYDHASSLGRELSDEKRSSRLRSGGAHGVEAYAERARSALYGAVGDPKPLSPLDAFQRAGALRPSARNGWLARCAELGAAAFEEPLARLPAHVASEPARAFASALIRYNMGKVLDLPKELVP
jgi:hypothetical protein